MSEPDADFNDLEAIENGQPLKLMGRVMRERWEIPDSLRGPLVERLSQIILDPTTPRREALSAANAILAASKVNLANIAMTMQAHSHTVLENRITALEQSSEEQTGKESNAW